jgi:mannose-6-phosphate isomerase-like protein (cupin superfamily)
MLPAWMPLRKETHMLAITMLMAASTALAGVPPVPGLCTAPVPENRDAIGCYQTGRLDVADAPATLYWHIVLYPDVATARAEAERHRWATVAQAHGRNWLYVLGARGERIEGGAVQAVIGPLDTPARAVTAHFAEAIFPPGMQTRVHSHPGPEAFFVVEGEQCMDTPGEQTTIAAGGTYIVSHGPHVQAAPKGRRNLVLILAPTGMAPVIPGGDWQPTGFCSRP